MEEPRANARKQRSGEKNKTPGGRGSRGRSDRGARGGRASSRGRGRGRGRASGRVVVAWNSDGDDASDEQTQQQLAGDEEWTASDYERLDAEIDDVVDVAELEVFAGTMVVDADDVELQREKIAAATANSEQRKKDKQKPKQPVVNEAKVSAEETQKKKKKKKKKKERVSVVVTEGQVLEIVQLEDEVGVTESGETIAISVKENKKPKNKKKKNAATTTEVTYESIEMHEVAELVEVTVVDSATAATKKKKKTKKEARAQAECAAPAGGESHATPPVQPKKAKKSATQGAETTEPGSAKKAKSKKEKQSSGDREAVQGSSNKPPANDKSTAKAIPRPAETTASTKKQAKDAPTEGQHATNALENFYEDYSDREAVMEAIERGELYQGKIRINPQYRLRAFLTVDGIPVDILIDGTKDRNRAMDGDLVAIKLHDEDKWKPLKETGKDDAKVEESKLLLEKNGPLPNADAEEKDTASRKVALNALWRPTLEASRCFLPQQKAAASGTSSSSPLKKPTVHSALSVAERSLELKCRPTAKVVFIIAAGNAQGFVGSLEPKTRITDVNAPLPPQDDYAYFNSQDLRLPRRIRIPRLQLPDEFVNHPLTYSQQMMCFCRITKWSASHESPMGEFVKTLGEYSGIESGISAILMKHGLMQHTLDFRHEILVELDDKYGAAGEKWTIPADEVAKRRDFRSYQIFSIDPYNARDLDDALHIRALNKEETVFEVGVHIADVTHFIDKGSFLDVEAQQRATSVYLANRVLPMLPRILCERLCSLQPQVDRLAFSVVWQMNSDGSLVEGCVPWFGKSIIRSCCKLDYGTAQRMLDGAVTKDKLDEWEPERRPIEGDNPEITPTSVIQAVKYLWKVAKHRRETRFDTGAVTLQDIKLTFTLDAMGNPTSFGTYQIKNSNRLVEEYMLLANYLVAQKLLQAQGPLAFIRRHPEPNETALATTLSILSENTIDIDGSSPKKLTDSLDSVRTSRGDSVYGVVQNMITKPMKPAEYLVAGNAGHEAAWCHYALNIPYYTHFTSPIRRYADVVVHRLLQESLVEPETVAARVESAGDALTQLMNEYQSVAQNCNEKKITSKNAEKESDQVFLCAYVKHHGMVDVTGVIVSTGQRSFTVYISELGLEQRIEVKDLGSVRWAWQEKTSTLSLEFGSKKTKRVKNKKTSDDTNEAKGNAEDNKTEEAKNEASAAGVVTPSAEPERVALKFLTKLRMRMTTTDRMPLALKFEVVGPWKE